MPTTGQRKTNKPAGWQKECMWADGGRCSGEDICSMEGFTVDTRAEDLRHVWIPLTLKMSISKSQGLEISSWPEAEEVSRSTHFHFQEPETLCDHVTLPVSSWVQPRRPTGPLSTTWWSRCPMCWMHVRAGTWSHTSKWGRRTIRGKRWDRSAVGAQGGCSLAVRTCDGFIQSSPAGRHAPAVVPLQRLPHRAHRQGDHFNTSGATRFVRHRRPNVLSLLLCHRPKPPSSTWAGRCPPSSTTPRGTTTPDTTFAVGFRLFPPCLLPPYSGRRWSLLLPVCPS